MTAARGGVLSRMVDRIVGVFSADRAALRAHFRAFENDADYRRTFLAMMHTRGYRAAKTGGGAPFSGGTRSADAEILGDRQKLCNRSRELNQDDPLASGLTDTFVNGVIGTGLWPKPCAVGADGLPDAAKNAALERVFWRLADNLYPAERLSYTAAQRLRFRKLCEDGEVFRRLVKRDPTEPLWFEVIEADRVSTPPALSGKGAVRDGIERDSAGVPVAVHVAKAHPGDTLGMALARSDFLRVEFPNIHQIGVKERPGQSRCVPMFHAILQDLRDLDLLLLASLKRVQIAACLSAFIKSPKQNLSLFEATAQRYGYKLDQALEPGMLFKLYPEEEIQTLIPNFPTPELGPFIVMLCRRIGAALGVSWQVVLRDFSESTYSGARTDKLDSFQTWDVLQYLFVEMDLAPEYREVMTDAVLRGEPELIAAGVTLDDCREVELVPNGRPWIDPKKEAEAKQVELAMGITSKTEICAKLGKHYPTVLEQRLQDEKLERERRAFHGLPEAAPASPPPAAPDPSDASDDSDAAPAPRARGRFSLFRKTA